MTLDEAIKAEENIAEENQKVVDMFYCDAWMEKSLSNYQRRAEEHKQVAEWLKELKMYRKALDQEHILDKIRAEIEQKIIPRESTIYDRKAVWQNSGLRKALKAIDKYRVEIGAEMKKDASDVLTVSFDSSLNDESALCVSRIYGGDKIIILKMESGEQADILYHLLTEQMTKAEIKVESE